MTDMTVQDHGTLFLLTPNTAAAKVWIDENVQEGARWWGKALVVEHRYIGDVVNGAINDGLTVEEK
ncbi:MAG: hypothetical protein NTX56_03980 [Proteobacteria bacterium]|nr:hypothetical protein [Pseudomonadota bacterium]